MDEDWRESTIKKEALDYHEAEPKGKIKVVPTKPHSTAHELSLADRGAAHQKRTLENH